MIDFEDSIYVAGHKGLAGSAICRALLRKGYKNLITVFEGVPNMFKNIFGIFSGFSSKTLRNILSKS